MRLLLFCKITDCNFVVEIKQCLSIVRTFIHKYMISFNVCTQFFITDFHGQSPQ